MEDLETLVAMRLFVALVAAAALVALVVRRVAIPYTVALVLLGLGVALVLPERVFQGSPRRARHRGSSLCR